MKGLLGVRLPWALPLIFAYLLSGCNPGRPQAEARPNFLVIITDDQRYDTMDFVPVIRDRIFGEGAYFPKAYVTTPKCCPSRASILTGMYAHNHGVHTNDDILSEETFVEGLHEAGYYTGYVGKYLNSWDGSPRSEFDFWVGTAGERIKYYDPIINVNGTWSRHTGYLTYILRDYATQFLSLAVEKDQPFLLIFAPKAPHRPAVPAPGDEALFTDIGLYRPPDFNEEDVSDKPQWLRDGTPPLDSQEQGIVDEYRLRQLQTLYSLDLAVGEILDMLSRQGKLDNTVIFFMSDNGFFWGEHRLVTLRGSSEHGEGKNVVYEPAIRVPFALRYPPLVPEARIDEHLMANIDIAPTIYQLAGLEIPVDVDGLSLVTLLQGSDEWRDDLLLEGWPEKRPNWVAVHTERYVYVETEGDIPELYDLEDDPYQLENRAFDPAYADIVADMKSRLERLQGK